MSEHHTFSVADAVEFGVNKAILLHNFRFWLGVNQRNQGVPARRGNLDVFNS